MFGDFPEAPATMPPCLPLSLGEATFSSLLFLGTSYPNHCHHAACMLSFSFSLHHSAPSVQNRGIPNFPNHFLSFLGSGMGLKVHLPYLPPYHATMQMPATIYSGGGADLIPTYPSQQIDLFCTRQTGTPQAPAFLLSCRQGISPIHSIHAYLPTYHLPFSGSAVLHCGRPTYCFLLPTRRTLEELPTSPCWREWEELTVPSTHSFLLGIWVVMPSNHYLFIPGQWAGGYRGCFCSLPPFSPW